MKDQLWPRQHCAAGEILERSLVFLRLGLPFTLILSRKRSFLKRLFNLKKMKTLAVRFIVDRNILKTELFRKRKLHDNHWIFSPAPVFLAQEGHVRRKNYASDGMVMRVKIKKLNSAQMIPLDELSAFAHFERRTES